jgi:hypothetical protein
MSGERYSTPEMFVDTWAAIQSIKDGGLDDPLRHVIRALQREALGVITDALARAERIADQVKRLQEDAKKATTLAHEVGDAINAACGDLPEGFAIELSLENGAATPNLYGPDGSQLNPEVHSGEDLADEIRDFIVLANACAAGEKASEKAKAVQP